MFGKGIIPILAVLLLSTCSREGAEITPDILKNEPQPHAFRVYDEEGITIAESIGPPKYEGELFTYVKVLELRQDPEVPVSLLNRPGIEYHRDEKGRFHIMDWGDQRVVVFGPEGTFLFSYGGRGAGPAEFLQANILRILDGRVTLFDARLFRSTVFTTDGELVDIFATPTALGRLDAIEKVTDQILLCSYTRQHRENRYLYDQRGIIAVSTRGGKLAQIETREVKIAFGYSHGGRLTFQSYPYLASPVVIYSPHHGILRSVGYEPLIEVFDINGALKKRIVLDLPREELTLQDKHAVNEGIRQFPRWKSHWMTINVDENGYFWLHCWEPADEYFEDVRVRFRLLSPEGEYLGDTRRPGPGGTVIGNRLLTWDLNLTTGELGTPVVYEMCPLQEGWQFP